jgi:hypothetical protein
MAALFLGLSLLGVVGCTVLLIIAARMWAEERAAKRAAKSGSASALQAKPEAAAAPPVPAEPARLESPAPGASVPPPGKLKRSRLQRRRIQPRTSRRRPLPQRLRLQS